jgi:DNA polymerase-1
MRDTSECDDDGGAMRHSRRVARSPVLLAVDGNSLVHRSYHAQARTRMRSVDGHPIWAIRGLLSQLVAAVERIGPDAIVVGFDDPFFSLRRDRWRHYKATRVEKLETLVEQLTHAADVLRALGVPVIMPSGLEADDVLASAAQFARSAGARTVIMTSDRDAFALIDEHTDVLRIIDGGVDASPLLTPARLVSLLGVRADQYLDYAALRGDASDNLPGVAGIGPRTAVKLLAALGSARSGFDDLADGGHRVRAAVGAAAARRLGRTEARQTWELNCQVMAMHTSVPVTVSFDGGPGVLPLRADAVRDVFTAHQLSWSVSAAVRVLAGEDPPVSSAASRALEQNSRVENLAAQSYVRGARRYPRLPRHTSRPRYEQLALFDTPLG